jgi:prepilin-type N-terminal cleavage/methylation domain-containing protein
MGIFGNKRQNDTGFTIIELIVVIVVISILAAIVLVAYPGYQMQARDNERKSDLSQVSTALGSYAFQKNTFVGTGSGCGRGGNGNGWLNAGSANPGAGSYPRSIADCLQDVKALDSTTFVDPSGCIYGSGGTCGTSPSSVRAYMKATCTKGGAAITYVFTSLESQPRKDAEVDALCDNNSVTGFTLAEQKWGSLFGMNYYLVVK